MTAKQQTISSNKPERTLPPVQEGLLHAGGASVKPQFDHRDENEAPEKLGRNGSSSARLLVVDDDDVDRERISRYIKKFKLPVVILDATNGSDAIKQIATEHIDLILLDYQLGDMTGAQVLGELQRREQGTIPTIMVTGMGDENTAIEAMRLGVVDYLPKKELNAETLISVLTAALKSVDLEKRLQESQENLRRMSLYDSLTGLPNRNLFFDRLDQSILSGQRKGSEFSVLMIDLNLFKGVNDSLGHAAGDYVLKVVGERLQSVARKSDTMARLGGDEFACILHDIKQREDIVLCVDKIIASISQPIAIGENVVQVGASIGVAQYPLHGSDQTTLLSNADFCMYKAKESHKHYEIYGPADAQATEKLPASQDLIKALNEKELFLEYQPKVSLNSGACIGAEVLLRWKSPKFGLVMPDGFIALAERSNLIESLTHSAVKTALEQMSVWWDQKLTVPLAFNISAKLLDNKILHIWLKDLVSSYSIDPRHITLEITETALASCSQTASTVLRELIDSGFRVSIDDFGSGFTSFKAVNSFDIAEIKIDKYFVDSVETDERVEAIVHSVVSLARRLGIFAVAEGVETAGQLEKLRELGCDVVQGYTLARPMRADDLQDWLKTFQTKIE